MTTDGTSGTYEQVRSRPELARQLLAQVDRLAPRLGDTSLAIEVQLLKRDLARGHGVLSSHPEDNNYLSIITLVEGTLASLTWKGYTPQVIDALRHALSAGLRIGPCTFEDYAGIRRQFREMGIPVGPTIGLSSADS